MTLVIIKLMHDVIHDLAMLVAGEECTSSNFEVGYMNENTRHISFEYDWHSCWEVSPSMLKANKVWTFLLLHSGWIFRDVEQTPQIEELCLAIFDNKRCLRVLRLQQLGIEFVPHSIQKMKHLRYLDLSRNESIKTLPDSITKLHNIQVLKLEYCGWLIHLPKDMKKLVSLRYLGLADCLRLTHMPTGIGELSYLEKLSRFVVGKGNSICGGLSELHSLNNLGGALEIVNLSYVKNVIFEYKELITYLLLNN